MKDLGYRIPKAYLALCARLGWRKFEVKGRENIPSKGRFIIVSNHSTGMMDPMAILLASPFTMYFGARKDIFDNPVAGALLTYAKMLPMGRARDGREAVLENLETFKRINGILQQGAAFALFPEGTHFPDYEVHPFKKGAARIAVSAAQMPGEQVYILPFGLEHKNIFRYCSDTCVNIGKAIPVSADADILELTHQCQQAVTSLTKDMGVEKPYKANLPNIILAALLFPLWLCCAAASLIILIPTAIIKRNMEDLGWSLTLPYCISLPFFPLWPFHSLFHIISNFYRRLER